MSDKEKSDFEKEWQKALADTEVAPQPWVWDNLDRELLVAEVAKDRKRIMFYQRLAAACAVFALLAGSFGVYQWKGSDRQLAINESGQKTSAETQKMNGASSTNQTEQATENKNPDGVKKVSKSEENSNQTREENVNKHAVTNNKVGLGKTIQTLAELQSEKERNPLKRGKEEIGSASNQTNKLTRQEIFFSMTNAELSLLPVDSINGEPSFKEIVRKLPAISGAFMAEHKKNNFNHEKVWASVLASTGAYSDQHVSSAYTASNLSAQPSSSFSAGNAYTFGMLGGMRVARRWVLQSGVQYMNQSAGYSSNISSNNLNAVADYASHPTSLNNANVSSTSYGITSTNEFVTVPVQAGFLLIDQKFGWQINSGVATDFFTRNTLSDPTGQRQSYSQGAGADSPYRSVNFAGLMSSEVSYKIGKNYRLSLVPGMRYSFNPILKSQSTGNPLVWDVGFRFRYIFR